jgi:4-amino-4-deoxy-L-arabinose transferase-like glycosyltransferase
MPEQDCGRVPADRVTGDNSRAVRTFGSPTVCRDRVSYAVVLLALLVASLGLYLYAFDSFQIGTYQDDAQYVVLAKSIAGGGPYGLVHPPDAVMPTRYPFGWPLLLAPAYALFGNFQSLKLVSLFFTLANTLLIAGGWKYLGFPGRSLGLATAALYAASPLVVGHARMVMSEPAFLFFVLLGLILTTQSTSRGSRQSPVLSIGLGVTWMFAGYVRTIGFALAPASALHLIGNRKLPQLVSAAFGLSASIAIVLIATPLSWQDLVAVSEYRNQFVDPSGWGQDQVSAAIPPRVVQGLSAYAGSHVRDSLIPFVGGPTTQWILGEFGLGFLPLFVSVLMLALILIGYASNIHEKGLLPTHVYVPLYMAVTIVWPWRGERFLYGVLPLLFAYLLIGGKALGARFYKRVGDRKYLQRWVLRLGLSALVLLLSLQVIRSMLIDDSLNHVRDLRVGTTWIKENTASDAVIIAEQAPAVHLYAERATIELGRDLRALNARLTQGNAIYLLLAPALKWSDSGQLEYSSSTRLVLSTLHSGDGPTACLVFEDIANLVQVYRLYPPYGMGR